MRFCKDCWHVSLNGTECLHPTNRDPVTGRNGYLSPYEMRGKDGSCGITAKLFQASDAQSGAKYPAAPTVDVNVPSPEWFALAKRRNPSNPD